MRRNRSQGFSLLELMVVVALVGLAAAMIVPNLAGPDTDNLKDAEERLRGGIRALVDRSLVRGELLAVRLEEKQVGFLRYDFAEAAFVPLDDERITFAESVRLEWQLPDSDSQTPDLAAVVEQRLSEEANEAPRDEETGTDEATDSDDKTFPQLFFFPSGEVTPATLWLRDADEELEVTLKLDSLGRIERPDRKGGDET